MIRENAYLVTLALVSPRRNSRSRAQTPIFTIFESRWLLRPLGHQTCQLRAWKPGFLSQESSAKRPEPGFLSQESSARIPQPGFLSQESSARIPQPEVLSKDSSARIPQPGISSQSVWGPRWSHELCFGLLCSSKLSCLCLMLFVYC